MNGKPVIGFAGLTHLGLISAVAAADKGFSVVAFDASSTQVEDLKAGRLPVSEPGLPKLLAANTLAFTADVGRLGECDVVYVAPDVPTDDTGASDLTAIGGLLDLVEPVLRPEATLVVLSQVPPGFTRRRGREVGPLYYQVETLIFGRAVERATQPERFIVGCADPGAPLPAAFTAFLDAFACPILPMRYESAELAKISINMCLVASVTTANTLAELCEHVGADWSEIVPALKLDRRIGPYSYLAPGLGIAGGNLERDLATVIRFAGEFGSDAGMVSAWIANSRHRRDWALRTLHAEVLAANSNPVIAVLGLAYKEDTSSTKNSPSLALIAHLGPFALRVFDPVVAGDAANHANAFAAKSPLEACTGADVVVIMTPWGRFKELEPAAVASAMTGRTVIDPYGVLYAGACNAAGLDYFTLGVPPLTADGE